MYVFRHGTPNAFQPGGRNKDYQLILGPSTRDHWHRHKKQDGIWKKFFILNFCKEYIRVKEGTQIDSGKLCTVIYEMNWMHCNLFLLCKLPKAIQNDRYFIPCLWTDIIQMSSYFVPTTPISLRRWRSHNICTKGNRAQLVNTCTELDSYIIIFCEYILTFWINLFITW
jgi:hypothetical protein